MASGLRRIAEKIPGLKYKSEAAWGAHGPQSRLLIRQSLVEALEPASEDRETLLNLHKRPRVNGWSISISHATSEGGWVALADAPHAIGDRHPVSVGLDIETAARITQGVIERMCTASEIAAAPQVAYLWAAKEAAYKSIPDGSQPQVLSAVSILTWQPDGPGVYRFTASVPGYGWLYDSGSTHYAVYAALPD
ncbi:MAG: 4'-phosphopantetheinyl transferase superfamily protein [Bdellovibrionales bacterium]|nr:4'-phosphopantetheinyl transferase superfamily protein [Bdellovibrionales bacterium]